MQLAPVRIEHEAASRKGPQGGKGDPAGEARGVRIGFHCPLEYIPVSNVFPDGTRNFADGTHNFLHGTLFYQRDPTFPRWDPIWLRGHMFTGRGDVLEGIDASGVLCDRTIACSMVKVSPPATTCSTRGSAANAAEPGPLSLDAHRGRRLFRRLSPAPSNLHSPSPSMDETARKRGAAPGSGRLASSDLMRAAVRLRG